MAIDIDLRYVFLPFINGSFMLLTSQVGGSPWDHLVGALNVDGHAVMKLMILIFAIFLFLLFLFISIRLPLIANPVHFRVGDFSIALTISLIASIILPPPLFWLAFIPVLIITSLYPSLTITCAPQHYEIPQPAPPQVDAELV